MTKLSLPGPLPVVNQPKKRKRAGKEADLPPPLSPEERLESLMDKLSMLQLTNHLETNGPKLNHNEKDWAQIFCESIVETMSVQLRFVQVPSLICLDSRTSYRNYVPF